MSTELFLNKIVFVIVQKLNLAMGENAPTLTDTTRNDIAVFLKDSCLETENAVGVEPGHHALYADGDIIRLVSFCAFALLSKNKLRSSSRKEKN